MEQQEFLSTISEILTTPLNVDSPTTLYAEAAKAEAYVYLAIKYQHDEELKAMKAKKQALQMREVFLRGINAENPKLSVLEKNTRLDSATADINNVASIHESNARYFRNIANQIVARVSMIQSILSNISASMRANLSVEQIK